MKVEMTLRGLSPRIFTRVTNAAKNDLIALQHQTGVRKMSSTEIEQEKTPPHAVVIGGTSGIGFCIIERLIALGYVVSFTYNSGNSSADNMSARFEGRVRGYRVDLSSSESVASFVECLRDAPAPVALVNTAGVLQEGLAIGAITERLRFVNTVNFLSPAIIASEVATLMAPARRGAIINVTSIASRKAGVGNAIYGSTKIALERFTASLALEVARFGIRTLCVAPGFVDTPMFRNYAKGKDNDLISKLPTREILAPEDVANPVIAFIEGRLKTTGTTIVLGNGEMTF
ncbi:SDR family oxidoreductase [Nguyenibacter vanlangensis]|uniref:SDR family oxidoreductase n=1 Tax=Nguyenibacter vanlangensis TaxID=1216886 RepID=A0ABZ3D2H8_9PROT